VFEGSQRVRSPRGNFTCYPDLSVVCGRIELASDDPHALANPVLVLEVLSDSTEAYDRGEKSGQYRAMPSIQEIVLISQHRQLESL
jgi:Uma2 family endonuclease